MTWHMYKVIYCSFNRQRLEAIQGSLNRGMIIHPMEYQTTEENEDPLLYWHENYLRPIIK